MILYFKYFKFYRAKNNAKQLLLLSSKRNAEYTFLFISIDTGKHTKKSENLFHNPGFEDPLVRSNWNCLGQLNHGSGGIMSRTIKYKRSGKYAGVCHNRIGVWAGPGQFIGELKYINLIELYEQREIK